MKLPYGYVLIEGEIAVHEEKKNVVCSIFDAYLAGASLGKIVDMLFAKGILSPTGKTKWTTAALVHFVFPVGERKNKMDQGGRG